MPRKLNSDLSRFVTCLISSDLYEKRRIDIRIGFFFSYVLLFSRFHLKLVWTLVFSKCFLSNISSWILKRFVFSCCRSF